jgi:hypothetical protein
VWRSRRAVVAIYDPAIRRHTGGDRRQYIDQRCRRYLGGTVQIDPGGGIDLTGHAGLATIGDVDGTLTASGDIALDLGNSGSLVVNGGAITGSGAVFDAGSIAVSNGGTATITGALSGGGTFISRPVPTRIWRSATTADFTIRFLASRSGPAGLRPTSSTSRTTRSASVRSAARGPPTE